MALFVAAIVSFTVFGCSKSSEPNKSAELQPQPIIVSSSPTPLTVSLAAPKATPGETRPSPAPPRIEEVNDAVARVFDKTATMISASNNSFFAGDFNGDGSEDIAVVTKPASDKLAEINNQLANWILEDPKEVPIPGTKNADQLKAKPVKVQKLDTLLAIIHGVGAQGWRNREARQTFLLRNAVGIGPVTESANKLHFAAANSSLPPLSGDVIVETINGRRGIIFWTGAKYAWLPYEQSIGK